MKGSSTTKVSSKKALLAKQKLKSYTFNSRPLPHGRLLMAWNPQTKQWNLFYTWVIICCVYFVLSQRRKLITSWSRSHCWQSWRRRCSSCTSKKKKKKETGAELSDLLVTYAEYIFVCECVWAHVCVRQSQRKKQSAWSRHCWRKPSGKNCKVLRDSFTPASRFWTVLIPKSVATWIIYDSWLNKDTTWRTQTNKQIIVKKYL